MSMRLNGEDVASGVRDAFKDELKKGPAKRHELGKHFLGVSTGTLGLFAALLKFSVASPSLDYLTVSCFAALLLATLIALYMSLPVVVEISGDLDVYDKYNEVMLSVTRLSSVWTLVWIFGFVIGVVKLFQ
ncbi:hypothetical protein [Pseudomonas helmanticensis]|uniref:hypothetical protein n=1 Tax=Pseudomonas helmanticensis TaxID=1471381 RepID=UPI0024B658DC|nr:hypothetical protein [Pseudomonas helmanticensis]